MQAHVPLLDGGGGGVPVGLVNMFSRMFVQRIRPAIPGAVVLAGKRGMQQSAADAM